MRALWDFGSKRNWQCGFAIDTVYSTSLTQNNDNIQTVDGQNTAVRLRKWFLDVSNDQLVVTIKYQFNFISEVNAEPHVNLLLATSDDYVYNPTGFGLKIARHTTATTARIAVHARDGPGAPDTDTTSYFSINTTTPNYVRWTIKRGTTNMKVEYSADNISWTTIVNRSFSTFVTTRIKWSHIDLKHYSNNDEHHAILYYVDITPAIVTTAVNSLSQIGGVGHGIVRASNRGLDDGVNITAANKQLLTISDNKSGTIQFRGEVEEVEQSRDSYTLIAVNAARKLLKTPSLTNTAATGRTFLFGYNKQIYDYSSVFPNDNSWDDKLISFEKKVHTNVYVFPTTITSKLTTVIDVSAETITIGANHTPFYTSGGISDTYYSKNASEDKYAQSFYAHCNDATHYDHLAGEEYYFDFWVKTGTVLTNGNLRLEFRTARIGGTYGNYGSVNEPSVWVYDVANTTWRLYVQASTAFGFSSGEDGDFDSPGSGTQKSPYQSIEKWIYNISGMSGSTDSLVELGTSGNYTQYRLRMYIDRGRNKLINVFAPDFMLFYARLRYELDGAQVPEEGVGEIASTTETAITLKAAAGQSWQTKEMPDEDGFTRGDVFSVGSDQRTAINSGWSDSGIDTYFTLELEAGLGSDIALTRDVQYENLYDLIQELCTLKNGFWYYYFNIANTPFDTIKIISSSNQVSTSMALTEADFIDYGEGNFSLRESTKGQLSKIIVIGRNGIKLASSLLSVDYSPALGNDTKVVFDPDIYYGNSANALVTSISAINANKEVYFQGVINISSGKQDYSALQIGQTVSLILATIDGAALLANYSAGNDGELMITSMQYFNDESSNKDDYLSIILQMRYS